MTKHKIAVTVIAAFGFIGTAAGLAVDLPQLITLYAQGLPGFMATADFWWVAGMSAVTLIGVAIVWLPWGARKDTAEAPGYPDYMPGPDRYVGEYRDRLRELTQDLAKSGQHSEFQRVVSVEADISIPQLLQRHFGTKARSGFEKAITEVRQKVGEDDVTILNMAFNYVDGELLAREQRRQAKIACQPAPPPNRP